MVELAHRYVHVTYIMLEISCNQPDIWGGT